MSELRFSVPALCCPQEGGQIERAVTGFAGLSELSFDYAVRELSLKADPVHFDQKAFLKAVGGLGYEIKPLTPAVAKQVLSIPEMDCPVEVKEITRSFERAGIDGVELNVMRREAVFNGDAARVAAVIEAVRAAGYDAEPVQQRRRESLQTPTVPVVRFAGALALALAAEALELIVEYRPGLLPVSDLYAQAGIIATSLAAIFMIGLSTLKGGLRALVHLNLNMNTLMAVAVIGGALIGAWPEAAMVMVLFEISEFIEQLCMNRARRSIRDLMSVVPDTAMVAMPDGSYAPVKTDDIRPGALVRVSPGDRIPLDGTVRTGQSSIDQSNVTGESMPVDKGPGDTVWGGTVNRNATLEITVTAAAADSLTARIIEAVENAQAGKSPVQRFVDRFAAVYTPMVFVAALFVAVIPPLFLGDFTGWLYKALCLLVIACPCALVISTPVTIVSALAAGTREGLLIKGGLYLEQARKLTRIAFDKTGTLTRGEPSVSDVMIIDAFDQKQSLALAASLAAMNEHPLSSAIVRYTRKLGIAPLPVSAFRALPGAGVEGVIRNGRLRLVNLARLEEDGLATPAVREAFARHADEGMSAVALADALGVHLVFALSDSIKDGVAGHLRELEAAGITPVLLTGDNRRAAAALAQKVGLTHVKAELLPQDKLAAIEALEREGVTAMVGDGINDAPALARADIGIAMGVRGTDTAIEAAHIALMDDNIGSILSLVKLSRRTHTILIENIALALFIKVVFALLALAGMATMWMAVFADTGTCLIVVANGMRMLRFNAQKH